MTYNTTTVVLLQWTVYNYACTNSITMANVTCIDQYSPTSECQFKRAAHVSAGLVALIPPNREEANTRENCKSLQ